MGKEIQMNIKAILINLSKLFLCSILFSVGFIVGGMIVGASGLQQPVLPEGMDASSAMLYFVLESPLMVLILALIARHLSGGIWSRALMLSSLSWVANSLNNQIEAAAFAGMGSGFAFTVLTFLFPALLVGIGVAWLFPPVGQKESLANSIQAFFSRYPFSGMAWRMVLGSILFMPIYYFFGLLVIPFTRAYYDQNLYGLEIPSLDKLLFILFIRSVLFFIAVLPILAAWRGSRWNLAWQLGLALFYLVGFQSLSIANWMPWALRLPHMIEILLDEFVYAGLIVWLLAPIKRGDENLIADKLSRQMNKEAQNL